MREVFTFIVAVLLTATVWAQSPNKMSYQAVIRDASDNLITDTQIGMQISILQGSAGGTAVYVETQTPSTNANGLVSIEIGTGTVESGDFTTIDWANGPYFIKTETDLTGGTSYTITGTSQLLSVPYALHSKTAESFISVTQVQRDALTPIAGLIVYNTTTNMPNYYNGTEWMLFDGSTAETLAIGDNYQGGKVAYILQLGDPGYITGQTHGIIAAPFDQSIGAEWGCFGTLLDGADGISVGTGYSNTNDIIAGCLTTGIAAEICLDLSLGGYSDWYLPSKYELLKLYENNAIIGGFTTSGDYYYWSSSEQGINSAWALDFTYGYFFGNPKDDNSILVRAVRSF